MKIIFKSILPLAVITMVVTVCTRRVQSYIFGVVIVRAIWGNIKNRRESIGFPPVPYISCFYQGIFEWLGYSSMAIAVF